MKKSRVGARGPNLSRQAPLLKRPRASLLLLADGEGCVPCEWEPQSKPNQIQVGQDWTLDRDTGGTLVGVCRLTGLAAADVMAYCDYEQPLSVAAVDVVPVTIRWETSLAFGNDEVRR
ncbi:hypothetical protein MGG_17907 [Pyricularia oryzae 70-15]|uniref:Uncharacterized protein n=3 Tax=Pyricularia oryzae TaxID=318829 RepID=G5EH15_PYRO7|nr:uncharacterized protein MGG_17907 [Pyricularia oryzae 70-15]EAQ71333.1 hypothetical protein MGCH7_ch7g740 [Pyricularia oryzae 70-15]EHA45999.1 hypothetical protein MGG_17907 [Pyricularia oryzae 70-15]ELQ42646.1 hypothetical protein OOU_Y34scaffold00199g4 [Pyricularia oryzae Y34]